MLICTKAQYNTMATYHRLVSAQAALERVATPLGCPAEWWQTLPVPGQALPRAVASCRLGLLWPLGSHHQALTRFP